MNLARRSAFVAERRRGFTLVEILIATMAFAVLLAALHTVLFSALKLRREAGERINAIELRRQAARVLARDLRNGWLGAFDATLLGRSDSGDGGRADTLDFYTTTGTVTDTAPWGEVQRVVYYLAEPDRTTTNTLGRTLTRAVYRNLLTDVEETPETTPLLRHVASFELAYYDGTDWQDTWDSTLRDDAPPEAVRVRLTFAEPPEQTWRSFPLELVIPWTARPVTEETDGSPSDAGGDNPDGSNPAPPPGGGGGSGPQPPPGGRQ